MKLLVFAGILLLGFAPLAGAQSQSPSKSKQDEGVLTAFNNCNGVPGLCQIRYSKDGFDLGGGSPLYEGISPVVAMVRFRQGFLIAFSNCEGNRDLHRIYYFKDLKKISDGKLVYQGNSPVTGILPYKGGVLVAFARCCGRADLNRVHYTRELDLDAKIDLGAGEIVYEGHSLVTAMAPWKGGVLTAFSYCANRLISRVHFSIDGSSLGTGPLLYEGTSEVVSILPYRDGLLTAFANCAHQRGLYRVHFSSGDLPMVGSGPLAYEGRSPILGMQVFRGGVLTAFAACDGDPRKFRVHWSPDGRALGAGEIRYEGCSEVTSISTIANSFLSPPKTRSGLQNAALLLASPNLAIYGSLDADAAKDAAASCAVAAFCSNFLSPTEKCKELADRCIEDLGRMLDKEKSATDAGKERRAP